MHVGMATGVANHLGVEDARFMREELAQWQLAEELGFDSLWVTEHHFTDYSMSPNPLMLLSWLAGQTKRIRLGTQVIVAPWYDPVRLAEQIVLLDHVSGGRAIIGFGRGLARDEYEGLRIDQNQARELYDEIIELVMGALQTGFIEGGAIFKQPRRELRPRPLRSLKGRAFAGGGTAASLSAAARRGLGRLYLNQPMPGGPASPLAARSKDDAPPKDAWLEAWREAHLGVPPPGPFVSNMVFVDDSADHAQELARTYVANTFRAAIKHYEMTSEHHGSVKGYEAYQAMRMKPEDVGPAVEGVVAQAIAGTPQQVLERLAVVKRNLDPQGFFPHLYTGGMPHADAVRNIQFFARHCLREVQSWQGSASTIGEPVAATG